MTNLELEAGMRALVGTLAPDRPLLPGAARVVDALQSHLGTHHDVAHLAPIDDASLTSQLVDPWLRQQLVRALIVGIVIDGVCTRADLARVEHIAAILGVDEPALTDVKLLLAGKRWRLRRHLVARFWVVDHVKARIAERGVLRTMVPLIYSTFFRRYRNPELARRYAALRELPEGSVGRAYIAYIDANKFGLPGERGAVSDIIVQHDLAHVLGDYGTAPAEEVLVASFSAGHRVKDPFAFIMFVMLQFHLGLRVTPGAKAERGHFDPARVLAAIARGAELNIDLTARWNYWPDLAEPLEAVRRKYNVSPRIPRIARLQGARARMAAESGVHPRDSAVSSPP
jgi:hypothetical protein